VSAEIGWDVDTLDWSRPGADSIAQMIMSVKPGQVILCHDGGGDRSQTIEALRIALPKLKEQGWTFVTIDELMAYGPAPDTATEDEA
jgi:peptidoglycan/xylan/chitin deacetylase (PgdA/CDA1 family)